MHNILFEYYFTFLEVLVLLFFVGGVSVAVYWAMLRRRQRHTDVLVKYDSEHFRTLHSHIQSAIAHEFVKGLDYISTNSIQTQERLEQGQNALREKQKGIVAKACYLIQHAENILYVFAPERNKPQKELLSIKQLVERVLLEFYHFAESKGVILRPNLDDVEPVALNRDLTLLSVNNVINNAIEYSFAGGVVETVLSLERDVLKGTEKAICIDVKDTGKGIKEQDQDKIFKLRVRGDGLIETGSGLGLYCAREAARRQGGDVILVKSSLNQGSVFRIMFPYSND